ncbi:MAG TPA: transporter substrate-binding domain-containing protein [Aliiroseovarius sp.]|nr:transporter substrate-binding domain-containing protein [Aliiroseovarius sp.]
MWSVIHQNNVAKIGENPNAIRVGMRLNLTCIDGLPKGLPGGTEVTAASTQTAPVVVAPGTAAVRLKINLMTADDYKPFTDRSLPGGGLITEVVASAMDFAAPPEGYAIHWVNDWSAHLEPLLSNALLDLGFPWLQPDCANTPDAYRCENFYFSDPMFEMLIMLFTDRSRPLTFNQDSDIVGKTLCRPAGYYTHDLDKNGRNWVRDGRITLETPDSIKDCFDLLLAGKVDAVALNEFTGRTALRDLGLQDRVEVVASRPLSIEGLYVLVHKSHPQAQALLAMINRGLRGIKDNGDYQRIIDGHMTRIWSEF